MRPITLDLYGFTKEVGISEQNYRKGYCDLMFRRPLTNLFKQDIDKIVPGDMIITKIRFRRVTHPDIWYAEGL